MWRVTFAVCAFLAMVNAPAFAKPGDPASGERARIAADAALVPPFALDGPSRQWQTHDRAQDPQNPGDFSWTYTYTLERNVVVRETIGIRSIGRPYVIRRDIGPLLARLDGAAVRADFDRGTLVARQSDDPAVRQGFYRGAQFAYRAVDDTRNALALLEIMPLEALAGEIAVFHATPLAALGKAPPEGDAIYVVNAIGALEPVAVRIGTTFAKPGSNDGGSPGIAEKARRALVAGGGRVHLIFGRQIVATLPVVNDGGNGGIVVPQAVPLGGQVLALASPTLGGSAAVARRGPAVEERDAAVALVARRLGVRPDRIETSGLAEFDLGRGQAIVGSARAVVGSRVDARAFFIVERSGGPPSLTLFAVSKSPLDAESGPGSETLVDALDARDGQTLVVTRVTGFDAHTFAIYERTAAGWKRTYTGGGSTN